MTLLPKRWSPIAIALFLCATLLLQWKVVSLRLKASRAEINPDCPWCIEYDGATENPLPPSVKITPFAFAADPQMIADFIWMKTAYYFGREALQDGTYTNLYGYLDAITRIDPQWEAPFLFAGYMIPPFAKDPDGGYELVLSGLDHHDEKWELHFIKAYIEWKEFENLPMAAQSLFDASQREGAPKMLLYLSATLANKASQKALTEMIVRQGLKKLTDETSRKRLLEKLENQP